MLLQNGRCDITHSLHSFYTHFSASDIHLAPGEQKHAYPARESVLKYSWLLAASFV